MKVTNTMIRRAYGHNGVECRVVVHRDGEVERHGSPDPADRSMDYWQCLGYREDIVRELDLGQP